MCTCQRAMGFGDNGDGFELGPGVSVPPGYDLDGFVTSLKEEQGPFVFIDDKTSDGKKFIAWMTLYEPSFFDWFMKLAAVKISAAALAVSDGASQIPEWVNGQTIRIRKSIWNTYQSCTARVQDLIAKQGKIISSTLNPTDARSFLEWWKIHDPAGLSAFVVMFSPETVPEPGKMPEMQFPKKLYDFWNVTKGTVAPPKPLLGMEKSWADWAIDNWLWIAGGTAGGVIAARWYMNQQPAHSPRETIVDYGEAATLPGIPRRNSRRAR